MLVVVVVLVVEELDVDVVVVLDVGLMAMAPLAATQRMATHPVLVHCRSQLTGVLPHAFVVQTGGAQSVTA